MTRADPLRSTLTCPSCGQSKEESMPTDACLWFYECTGCRTLLHPKPGDCCVFCSYGTRRCPPRQADAAACCGSPGPAGAVSSTRP